MVAVMGTFTALAVGGGVLAMLGRSSDEASDPATKAIGDSTVSGVEELEVNPEAVRPPAYDDADAVRRANVLATWVECSHAFEDKRFSDAAREAQKLIDLGESSADVHEALGRALWLSGDSDGARKALQQAIAIDHNHSMSYVTLASVDIERQPLTAIQLVKEGLERASSGKSRDVALGVLATAYLRLVGKDFVRATRILQEDVANSPDKGVREIAALVLASVERSGQTGPARLDLPEDSKTGPLNEIDDLHMQEIDHELRPRFEVADGLAIANWSYQVFQVTDRKSGLRSFAVMLDVDLATTGLRVPPISLQVSALKRSRQVCGTGVLFPRRIEMLSASSFSGVISCASLDIDVIQLRE